MREDYVESAGPAPVNSARDGAYDSRRVMAHIRALSFPRRTGSSGEGRAIDYLAGAFESLGVPVSRREFSFSMLPHWLAFRLILFLLLGLALTALWVYWRLPILSLFLALCLLAGLSLSTRWSRLMSRLYVAPFLVRRSANLIASLEPPAVKGRLVLMAHYDSKSQGLPLYLRTVLTSSVFFGLAGIAFLMLLFHLTGARDWIVYLWFPAILLSIPLFLMVVNFSGNDSPGALDNAASLAVMVELARCLRQEVANGIGVIFLMTGAEEEGLAGAVDFVKRDAQAYPVSQTYVLNMDGIGASSGLVLSSSHGIPRRKTGGRLEAVMKKVAKDAGLDLRVVYHPLLPGLDHVPVAAAGYRAVTLTSSDTSLSTFSIHTPYDRPENVDPEALRDAYRLIRGLIGELRENSGG